MIERIPLILRGQWRVTRVSRETGEVLSTHEGPNTIQTAGLNRVLDCMIGDSSLHLDQANADLVIRNSSDTVVKTITGADSGYPDHSTQGEVVFQWSDISTEQYEADDLLVKRDHGGSDDLTFSVSDQNLGNKPDSENWIYEYTLSIGNGGDTDLKDAGLDHILHLFTGDSSDHFNNGTTQLELFNSSDSSVGTVACDDGFPSRSSQTVTWEFTSPAGEDSVDWDDVEVQMALGPVVLNRTNEALGTKGSNTERQYTFDFTLS